MQPGTMAKWYELFGAVSRSVALQAASVTSAVDDSPLATHHCLVGQRIAASLKRPADQNPNEMKPDTATHVLCVTAKQLGIHGGKQFVGVCG